MHISLCNVIYKLIAKAMTNSLKGVLNHIISPSQYAFIPGHLISDNVMVGFKCIHSLNNHKKGKLSHVAMKLDMSKAYDRVEWPFIDRVMS